LVYWSTYLFREEADENWVPGTKWLSPPVHHSRSPNKVAIDDSTRVLTCDKESGLTFINTTYIIRFRGISGPFLTW
jgi:hypothetical protein